MASLLLSIKSLKYADCSALSNSVFIDGWGIRLDNSMIWEPVCLSGLADYNVSESVESKSRIYTHQLSATLMRRFDVANRNLCYLLETVRGEKYLLGMKERPFPISTIDVAMPGREAESSGYKLNISLKSPIGTVRVID